MISRYSMIALALVCLQACTDENIVNVPQETVTQGIVGRAVPPEPGVVVAAWQAVEVRRATADDSGYFTIQGLPPGLYELRMSAPSGAHRNVYNVAVEAGETTALGAVQLQELPDPLLSLSPEDGTVEVSPLSGIAISSQLRLSLASLASEVTMVPTLTGQWTEFTNGGYFEYRLLPPQGLACATTYTVTVSPNLLLNSGTPLGTGTAFTFQTDSLRTTFQDWGYYGPTVPWDFTGWILTVAFNAYLDDAAPASVSIDPVLPMHADFDDYQRRMRVFLDDKPATGTDYRIIFQSTLADAHGQPLGAPDTLRFSSESLALESLVFPNSQYHVPPSATGSVVDFRFTVPIHEPTATAAVSIVPPVPFTVAFSSSNYGSTYRDILSVRIPNGLLPASSYQVTVASTLASYDGRALGATEVATFAVQPLNVVQFGFSGYPYDDQDTIVAPGDLPTLYLRFNTGVNLDSLNAATSIAPAIPGFWYHVVGSDTLLLAYFPTAPVDLPAEATYVVTVDGVTGLVEDIGLGADAVFRFHTEPVSVAYIAPTPGSQFVYGSDDIRVRFNTRMDKPSTEAAFLLETFAGVPVPGTFYWYSDSEVWFNPSPDMIAGESYHATISTTARSAAGPYLKVAGETFFRVRL